MQKELTKETVNVTIENRVATVEMNRPEALNALNQQLLDDLSVTMDELANLEGVDIVVLTGKGKAFSSGGDIKSMLTMDDKSQLEEIMDSINNLVLQLYTMPKLTISAISGAAAGLGLSIALATDYAIAHKSAKIAMNFIGIGLIPDGGGHFFLEQRLGTHQAKQLIWEGKVHTAEEALKLGLVDEVAEDTMQAALETKLAKWLNSPVLAMIKTKQILAQNTREQLLNVFEGEKLGQAEMRQTADHLEGIKAFVEKRHPVFTGK